MRERRSTNDEEVALPEAEHSLVTVVVGRGMSREAGREPRGENAPVSLLGLMSSGAPLPSLNKHGGGTEMRGSEWIPRGEPEDSGGAVFFIGCVFFSARAARGQQRKRKKGPERKGVFDRGALPRCTLIYLFSPFSFLVLCLVSTMRTSFHRPSVAAPAPEHALLASRAAACARPATDAPKVLLAPPSFCRRRLHFHRRRFDSSALRATLTSTASASLMRWLVEDRGMETPAAEPGQEGGLVARRAIGKGEVRIWVSFFLPFSTLPLSLAPSRSLSPSLAPSLSPSSPLLQLRHQPIVTIPGDLAVTAVDAAEHPSVGGIVKASGVGDVVALALWLLAERGESASAGGGGAAPPPPPTGSTRKDWGPLLASLPATSDSPVLWPETERKELLRGSPVLSEARERDAALDRQWAELEKVAAESGGGGNGWPPGGDFTRDGFRGAVAAVLANATYLPAAGCFALLPLISVAGRTGRIAGGEGGGGAGGGEGGGASESGRGGSPGASSSGASSSSSDQSSTKTGALLDYDESLGAAVLSATRPYAPGEQVLLGDGRPSGELLLATGELYADDDPLAVARATNLSTFTTNPSECLTVTVGLVPTDRLLVAKRQILEAAGFPPGSDASQAFPIFPDRMPLQLLAYLRLARLQESAQLASVTFENDVIISQLNEYEVLQLLSGECKERLGNYGSAAEDDLKTLQRPDSSPREKVAARLRLAEKSVLQGTLDAVRRRLAPIRGVPTKDGSMTDANADLLEIFGALEALPSVPGKIVGGFMSWARGDNDPEFQKSRNRRK